MANTKIDLTKFCWQHSKNLTVPFSRGEFTYASDGKIAIRVPRDPEFTAESEASEKCEMYFSGFYPAVFTPMPSLPEAIYEVCSGCSGEGLQTRKTQSPVICESCEDEFKWETSILIEIKNRIFASALLRKLESLPGLLICADSEKSEEPMKFTFEGQGQGLIMPMRHYLRGGDYMPEYLAQKVTLL